MNIPELVTEDTVTRSFGQIIQAVTGHEKPASGILVMIDGLGWVQLQDFLGHTPFLRSTLRNYTTEPAPLSTVFPTTTAAALSSVGTGLDVGSHGIIGYDVLDPDRGVVINQLGQWDEKTDPNKWQPHPSIFEQLGYDSDQVPLRPVTVSLPDFKDSALTRASLNGSEYFGANSIRKRIRIAIDQAKVPGTIVYLYFNELDKAGHRYGPGSDCWIAVLEELDAALKSLARGLTAIETPVFAQVTGDHGMIEVPVEQRIDFSLIDELIDGVAFTAGEPRFVQLHFDEETSQEQRERTHGAWLDHFGDRAWTMTKDEALNAGVFGTVDDRVSARIGDLIIAGVDSIALYDGRRATPASFDMVGHHGSMTDAERWVPWLSVGNEFLN